MTECVVDLSVKDLAMPALSEDTTENSYTHMVSNRKRPPIHHDIKHANLKKVCKIPEKSVSSTSANNLSENDDDTRDYTTNTTTAKVESGHTRTKSNLNLKSNCLGHVKSFLHAEDSESEDAATPLATGLAERLAARSRAKESLAVDTYLTTCTSHRLIEPPSERFMLRFPSFPRCIQAIRALSIQLPAHHPAHTSDNASPQLSATLSKSHQVLREAQSSRIYIDEALETRSVKLTPKCDSENAFKNQGIAALNYLIEASYLSNKCAIPASLVENHGHQTTADKENIPTSPSKQSNTAKPRAFDMPIKLQTPPEANRSRRQQYVSKSHGTIPRHGRNLSDDENSPDENGALNRVRRRT